MHLCPYFRRHSYVRGNGHLIFFRSRRCIFSCIRCTIDNIGGSACEAVGYFNRSLRSCYFLCVVNERVSFASFACAVEGAR